METSKNKKYTQLGVFKLKLDFIYDFILKEHYRSQFKKDSIRGKIQFPLEDMAERIYLDSQQGYLYPWQIKEVRKIKREVLKK